MIHIQVMMRSRQEIGWNVVAVIMGTEPRFRATLWDDACYQGRLDQEGVS